MSKMVKRIVLLLLVTIPILACVGTPTPRLVYPTPEGPLVLVETVTLNAGEAARAICLDGPVSVSQYRDEVIIYCLESY